MPDVAFVKLQGATGATGATGAGYAATSATSLLIAIGSKSFTTQAGLAYSVGARVRASSTAGPTNYMEGLVTSYSGTTLVILIDTIGGSGTLADWKINLAGNVGATGTSPSLGLTTSLYNFITLAQGVAVSLPTEFAVSSPGGTMTAAVSVTITIAPVPPGLNGANTGHYLRIAGGVGAAEVVLITGGTAVAGAASGTIIFTPANSHSGAWTVGSATVGITEAMWALPVTGGRLLIPAGEFTIYAPVIKRTITVFIQGGGIDVTTLNVATTFSLTALGVFVIPDDTSMHESFTDSGGYSDFTIAFTQPDSTNIAAYTQWPPAFYGNKTNRPLFERLKGMLCWVFVYVDGFNGIDMYDCKASFFRTGIYLDSHADSARIYSFEGWIFGLTVNQQQVMICDPNCYAFRIYRMDDLTVFKGSAVCNFAYLGVGTSHLTGFAWASFVGCDMDAGGFWMASTGGRASISGGSMIGGITKTGVLTERFPIKHTDGELTVTDSWLGFGDGVNTNTASMVDVDFTLSGVAVDYGNVRVDFSNCRFYLGGGLDVVFINVRTTGTNTGTVRLNGCRFTYPGSISVAITNPIIKAIGKVRVVATGNVFTDKYTLAGTVFSADTDNGHIFTGNCAPCWTIVPPSSNVTCKIKDNVGVTNPVVYGADVASAATITPTGEVFRVSGTFAIQNIAVAMVMAGTSVNIYKVTIIPTGVFSWVASANIGLAGTAVVGKALTFLYDPVAAKWYPSYV